MGEDDPGKREELLRKYLIDECVVLLASKDFGYSVEEAKGICGRKEITDAIKKAIEEIKEGKTEVDVAVAKLGLFIGTKVEPKVAAAPKAPRIPAEIPKAREEVIADDILHKHPLFLLITSLEALQKEYAVELEMTEGDIPGVAKILERRLAAIGKDKMKRATKGRDTVAGWVLATKSSTIVYRTLSHAIHEMRGDIINAYRFNYPGSVEEIGATNLLLAIEGYVMENLGVSREDMPENIPPAMRIYER